MPNDITVTKNTTVGSERWDVAYTADQAATVEKTLDTAGTLLDRDIKVSVTVPAGTEGTPTTQKGRVSNHSVQVLSSVTNTAGYISGGTHTDPSGVFVSASELVSGTKTITQNGSHDVTNYASAEVSVPTGTARTSADLTASGDTVTAPAGLYAEAASKAVAAGSVAAPTATKGKVTNNAMNITPHVLVTAGYVSGGDIAGSQVQVAASELVSGTKTIDAAGTTDVTNYAAVSVPEGVEGTPTNVVSPVNNHSVIVSPRVTNTEGYIPGTQKVGNNTTIYASDLVSGAKTITGSGTTDVTNYADASVAAGSAATPATTITANPTISVNSSTGVITATASASKSVTPSVSAGWVSSGTAGTVSVSGSNTQQLSTQAAQTITPGTTDQTIAAGKYLTGAQTIKGDANLVAANIAKDVSIFGVTGTHEGGGGGGAALVYEDNVSASTTSTSETIIKTVTKTATEMNMGRQATLVAVVRDNAGTQTNHYVGGTYCTAVFSTTSDTYVTRDWGAWVYHSQTVSKGVVKTYTEPYGVYPKYSRSGSAVTIQICSRYTSQSSYRTNTISGTYNIKIYSISPTGIDLPDV